MNIYCMDKNITVLDKYQKLLAKVYPEAQISYFTDLPILLNAVLQGAPDLVILDADAVGSEVATKKMFASNPAQNIIYSARTDKHSLTALQLNVSGYVMKPISEDVFTNQVRHLRFPIAV